MRFGYQPLWPFRNVQEARRWQVEADPGGHQPWHYDADFIALMFTRQYLGFTEIDRVVAHTIGKDEAHVSVGSANEGGTGSHTAAVIHLVRFGVGKEKPWEVVGTRDADVQISITSPRYGARVSSPLTVGGRITGVDESIHVQVRQISSATPIGEFCCIPAGGENQPWSARVSYVGATDPALTVVAWTGGHLYQVERFAVTGVQPSARAARAPAARDGDIDGDGRPDHVALTRPGLLTVDYSADGSEDVRFAVVTGPPQRLLGAVDADHDGHAEVFVRSAAGASTDITSVFRYVDGHLRLVTLDGGAAQLVSGGSVTRQDSWTCRLPDTPIVTWSGTSTDGRTFRGEERRYRFSDATLTLVSRVPLTATSDHLPPTGCGSLQIH
jgi:hypothetical protein